MHEACRALRFLNVNIALLTETRLTDEKFPHTLWGYRVVATKARSASQGGIALVWDENHAGFKVEEVKLRNPNVLTFELKTGHARYYVVGCYIPPSSLELLEPVRQALKDAPADKRVRAMMWGDLNVFLDIPISDRDEAVADVVDGEDLVDVSRHFACRRSRNRRGR